MAGKLIKRKKIRNWIDDYVKHHDLKFVSLDVDMFAYSSNVSKNEWEKITLRIYQYTKRYCKKNGYKIKIGMYMEAVVKKSELKKDCQEISHFKLSEVRPPNIFLYRDNIEDLLPHGSYASPIIGDRYGMQAWLHHSNEDRKQIYYLFLS